MQCGPMAAARVADGAKCLAGKKDRGAARKPEGREGPAGGLSPQALLLGRGSWPCECRAPTSVCMVKLKLFRRGFFFPRCAAVGCRTGSRRSARGSSTCRTRLFFIVALTSSPTSSPIFSARNPASSANCLIISCVSGNGVMRSPPLYSILIANRGRPFGVFTRTGSENDLPLSIGMPFRFPPLRTPRCSRPQQSAKMLAGATLWSATQICSYGSRPTDFVAGLRGEALWRPYVKGYRGYLKIEFPRHPDASVERIHLYSIDAALADRADSDAAVGRNISASYGRGALGFTMHNSALSALSLGTVSRPIPSGRPLKFTPERIQQIKNLVERGTGRDEIAALIGVTVGSLAVTCSRLGISLRRPKLNNGINVLQRRRLVSTLLKREPTHMKPDEAKFALILQYNGRECTTDLLLSPDKIGILALEAEFRSMSISAFISELITSTVKNDLFRQMLDTESHTPAGQPTT